MSLALRRADRDRDADAVWAVLEPVFRAGATYAIDADISPDDGLGWWFGDGHEVWVATADDVVVGTYYLGANQGGHGRHVANAGYAVDPGRRRLGVGRTLAVHSLERARERGFTAMQFNFVVASNEPAIRLWRSLGFEVVGRIPDAFDHPQQGLVDALVMHRRL